MLDRSRLLVLACLLAAIAVASAQPPAKVVRVGYLSDATLAVKGPLIRAFLQGMRDLGYVEGQNLVMEYRFAEGSYDRLPSLAAELIQTKPDVILTSASAAARAAKQATATIPIVMVAIANPVGQGLVGQLRATRGKRNGSIRSVRRPGQENAGAAQRHGSQGVAHCRAGGWGHPGHRRLSEG